MNINGPGDLLEKINSLQQGAKPKVDPSKKSGEVNFQDVLKGALDDVDNLQSQVKDSVEKMLTGETKDVDTVMNKLAEAGVAFDLMVEIKNKVIDAYKQLERMNI